MSIEEIKMKKLQEYLGQSQEQERLNQVNQLQQNITMLESIAKKIMSKEAISRYGNLKLAHPETALKAILAIAQIVESGYKEEINDEKFKEILIQIQKQGK